MQRHVSLQRSWAASEGAVVVSRAERSLEPFELVASELLAVTER